MDFRLYLSSKVEADSRDPEEVMKRLAVKLKSFEAEVYMDSSDKISFRFRRSNHTMLTSYADFQTRKCYLP